MHPNAFLETFWRLELRQEVFVAMSFAPPYQSRYDDVIVPVIRSLEVDGHALSPVRVDLSRSGDSILSAIVDGIAHSRMILADVSVVGRDSITGVGYRNGNVMYEVGIALACRQPSDVLLVRDDRDPFLFDVSAIPHMTLDFTDGVAARVALYSELNSRLREQAFIAHARVQTTLSMLDEYTANVLAQARLLTEHGWFAWRVSQMDLKTTYHHQAFFRLLEKRLVEVAVIAGDVHEYTLTDLGKVVADALAPLPDTLLGYLEQVESTGQSGRIGGPNT